MNNIGVLDCIEGKVLCITAGEKKYFESGEAAKAYYSSLNGKFAIKRISVEGKTLILTIEDMTDEIDSVNKDFTEKYKKENGVEPSFFQNYKKNIGKNLQSYENVTGLYKEWTLVCRAVTMQKPKEMQENKNEET